MKMGDSPYEWQNRRKMDSLGIYISVPFCRAKCTYCNFASGVSSPATHEAYVQQVCAEIRAVGRRLPAGGSSYDVDSVYLGGGTPSTLAPSLIKQLGSALRQEFTFLPGAEITLECAPGQLDDRALEALLAFGVNRISFGVQSLVDREAQATGRFHTRAAVLEDLARVRAAGVENISIDLIAGMPYQTAGSWQESLEVLAATAVPHASIYMLEIDDDSRLGRELLAGGSRYHAPAVPSEDQTADFYESAIAALRKAGLEQYEISNFASRPWQSRHNQKYWRRQSYLGFGLDAHSMTRTLDGTALRWSNPDMLEGYMGGAHVPEARRLNPAEELEEAWFLGLRLRAGVCWEALEVEFGAEALAVFRPVVRDLEELGLLTDEAGLVRLTSRGVLFSNEVFARFLGVTEFTPEPQRLIDDPRITVL